MCHAFACVCDDDTEARGGRKTVSREEEGCVLERRLLVQVAIDLCAPILLDFEQPSLLAIFGRKVRGGVDARRRDSGDWPVEVNEVEVLLDTLVVWALTRASVVRPTRRA